MLQTFTYTEDMNTA